MFGEVIDMELDMMIHNMYVDIEDIWSRSFFEEDGLGMSRSQDDDPSCVGF